jgi:hypothetical protein
MGGTEYIAPPGSTTAIYTWASDSEKGEITLKEESLTLNSGTFVLIAPSTSIHTGSVATIEEKATFRIAEGSSFNVEAPGRSPGDPERTLVVKGTVEVLGTIDFQFDLTAANSPFSDNKGVIKLLPDSTAKIGATPVVFISPASGGGKLEWVADSAGSIEFSADAAGTRGLYAVKGEAELTLKNNFAIFSANTWTIEEDATLTYGGNYTISGESSSSTLIIEGTIAFGGSGVSNFYTVASGGSAEASPSGTYTWNSANTRWVKTAS